MRTTLAMVAVVSMAGNVILIDDPPLLFPEPPEPPAPLVVEESLLFGAPIPPATLESCANPIEGGLARKTEYTFFKKEFPTTQAGGPE